MSYYPGTPGYQSPYAPYNPPFPNWMPPGPMPQQPQQAPGFPQMPQPALVPTQQQNAQQSQPQQFGGLNWVQGEAGAKGFQVEPGRSALLMDAEGCTFYLKSADSTGMPSMRIFDYQERMTQPAPVPMQAQQAAPDYITRSEFAALAAEVKAMRQQAGGADNA